MAALRAFRKPEVSLERDNTIVVTSLVSGLDGEVVTVNSRASELHLYSAEEREPLPLALHHTPLCVSVGIFKNILCKSDVEVRRQV